LARGGYSDLWAAIAANKLLSDGTKEEILNLVAHEPRTIAQLAKELNLSQPSIHAQVSEMLNSELMRESAEWEKRYPAERY
jgi:predicted transcriptional regulator